VIAAPATSAYRAVFSGNGAALEFDFVCHC
jgi:hypothetical protein